MEEKYAMIFAAGLGKRLTPITNNIPKALIRIAGKPLLWHILQKLIYYQFHNIVINVHYLAEQIIDYINSITSELNANILISHEKEFLAETGGGLKHASNYFHKASNILLHNVDILSNINLEQLWNYHIDKGVIATLAVSKRPSYRQLIFNHKNLLCGWLNIKTKQLVGSVSDSCVQFAFSGIHVISTKIFDYMPSDNVFSLIDLYLKICDKVSITFYEHMPTQCLDVGKHENLFKAEQFLKHIKINENNK